MRSASCRELRNIDLCRQITRCKDMCVAPSTETQLHSFYRVGHVKSNTPFLYRFHHLVSDCLQLLTVLGVRDGLLQNRKTR